LAAGGRPVLRSGAAKGRNEGGTLGSRLSGSTTDYNRGQGSRGVNGSPEMQKPLEIQGFFVSASFNSRLLYH
jgi:hypothetical protein